MALTRLETEIEIPKTLLIDHTDPSLVIDWPTMGTTVMDPVSQQFRPTDIQPAVTEQSFLVSMDSGDAQLACRDVRNYRRVSVLISPTTIGYPYLLIGKYDALFATLPVPADGNIHSFDIVGPDMLMYIWGQTSFPREDVRLYLYLSS